LSPSPVVELARTTWNFARNRLDGLRARLRPSGQLVGQQFRDLRTEIREDLPLLDCIIGFTNAPSFPADIFDAAGIRDAVARHRDSGDDQSQLLSCLATFAMAHRLFLADRPTAVPASIPWPGASLDGKMDRV